MQANDLNMQFDLTNQCILFLNFLDLNAISAILKVQRCQEELLTPAEKRFLKSAEIQAEVVDGGDDNPRPTKKFKEKLKERKISRAMAGTKKSSYHKGVKAIMGSAAVVESHHSRAKKVLTEYRSSMDPLIFEAIMYLKMNRRLWGRAEVVEANRRRKKAIAAQNRNLKEQHQQKLRDILAWEEAQQS